jgi:hypothetical protein
MKHVFQRQDPGDSA